MARWHWAVTNLDLNSWFCMTYVQIQICVLLSINSFTTATAIKTVKENIIPHDIFLHTLHAPELKNQRYGLFINPHWATFSHRVEPAVGTLL